VARTRWCGFSQPKKPLALLHIGIGVPAADQRGKQHKKNNSRVVRFITVMRAVPRLLLDMASILTGFDLWSCETLSA
jgi:hypothetical protein